MSEQRHACCTSPAALCYWGIVSLVAWAILSLAGAFYYPLRTSPIAIVFFAMAIGCAANWRRNRTLHCVITAPLFLIGGALFLLASLRVISVDLRWLWALLAIGICAAFIVEWCYAGPQT